jgi:RimJ/RimL family protein N-acetyltransferase
MCDMTDDQWTQAPTLRGDQVFIRPTVPADAEGMARAYDDPDTFRYFPFGIESEPPSAATVAHALASGRITLTQIDAHGGQIVGSTSMYNISRAHGRVTVGYTWLSSKVRGTAVNSESKLLLLGHIFDVMGARRVEFNVDDLNSRSRAAVLAIGAAEEGALRNHARRRDGTWRTTMVYSVIDDEWPSVRAALQRRIGVSLRPPQPRAPDRLGQ